MTNLDLGVDGRALKRETSVDAEVREHLESDTGISAQAVRELLAMSSEADSRRGDRRWTRDELYER